MAKNMLAKHYNEAFYDRQVAGSVSSAEVILGLLYDFYQPQSVIDVGCGRGAWLSVAESLGTKNLIGLDGHWNTKDKLLSQNIDFTSVDLEGTIDIREKYDLCISLEVAEHLAGKRAKTFIENLCKASNVVLFSAAIVNQGGTNHINEQWQSYWIELFQANGYECFDIFRGVIWENEKVELWYRQNIFLFIKISEIGDQINTEKLKEMEEKMPNIVHPKYYERLYQRCRNNEGKLRACKQMIHEPTIRFCLGSLKRCLFKAAK